MTTNMNDFLAVGMKKYKQATAVMISFQNVVEERLQEILTSRPVDSWGEFLPGKLCTSKTGRTWNNYPTAIAKLEGAVRSTTITVEVVVSWYTSENNYPIYSTSIHPREHYLPLMKSFDWQHPISEGEWGIMFTPDENDFDLERDFNLLLDELVRFLSSSDTTNF